MGSGSVQALFLAMVLTLSAGTAFGLGSKGDGMQGTKDAGMMQDDKAGEKKDGMMKEEAGAMQEEKMMKKDDGMMKDEGMGKDGMEKKEAAPMR